PRPTSVKNLRREVIMASPREGNPPAPSACGRWEISTALSYRAPKPCGSTKLPKRVLEDAARPRDAHEKTAQKTTNWPQRSLPTLVATPSSHILCCAPATPSNK